MPPNLSIGSVIFVHLYRVNVNLTNFDIFSFQAIFKTCKRLHLPLIWVSFCIGLNILSYTRLPAQSANEVIEKSNGTVQKSS